MQPVWGTSHAYKAPFSPHHSIEQTLLQHVTICTSAVYGGSMRVEVHMNYMADINTYLIKNRIKADLIKVIVFMSFMYQVYR